ENDLNGREDVFVHDTLTGETRIASVSSVGVQGNDHSSGASISADGRFVAFASAAYNLVFDDTNQQPDVFVHDMLTGETILVSVSTFYEQGDHGGGSPIISGDGHSVIFASSSTNLVSGDTNQWPDTFLHNLTDGSTYLVSVSTIGTQGD